MKLTKIEIAAQCPFNNTVSIDCIKSLPHFIKYRFYYHDYSYSEFYTITSDDFDDIEELHSKLRNKYSTILSKQDLSHSLDNVKCIEFKWSNKTFNIFLNSDDAGYDHVLTDVRLNNRSLSVPLNTYSICSCINNIGFGTYVDIYISIHTC